MLGASGRWRAWRGGWRIPDVLAQLGAVEVNSSGRACPPRSIPRRRRSALRGCRAGSSSAARSGLFRDRTTSSRAARILCAAAGRPTSGRRSGSGFKRSRHSLGPVSGMPGADSQAIVGRRQEPERLVRFIRFGGAGNAGHRIVRGPVAKIAPLERRSLARINNNGALGRCEFKRVAAQDAEVMRVPVVVLAWIILRVAGIVKERFSGTCPGWDFPPGDN